MIENNFAFRIFKGQLEPILNFSNVTLRDLVGLDRQISQIKINIESFLKGELFLDTLLWGERGCGKSSLVKAIVNNYKDKDLRIIQIDLEEINFIYEIYKTVNLHKNLKFILFFDDISFDKQDAEYRKFKSTIEGGLEEKPPNSIIIATTNKRHLIKDESSTIDSIYSSDEISEQMSLYARFGLTISFRPPSQETYLKIVEHYLHKYHLYNINNWEKDAISFAISKGTRSGRVAKQFVISKSLGLY